MVSGWLTAGRGDGGLVAEVLKVDTEALAEAARQLRELSGQVEESALAAQPRLIQAGAAIPGSRSGGEAGHVATSVGHALGDLATALSALGVGLNAAGAHFARVDAEAAAAARGSGTPSGQRSPHPPDAPGVRGPR